ncbi:SDR family NAD(P)-dependent oxidoreductase [Bacillus sp. NPDC077411]|uniref:SDR family NAD(P)-dependent oxidoreductase n=1 Tax=Bacillus sp. NPDC077411 TaxID=3363947 RepID=UPI0037C88DEA
MKVLITGANRGLGFELANIFYNNGHIIFPVVRKQQELQKLTHMFPDRCYPILADLNDDKSVEKIKTSLNKYTGCIDLVINNAIRNNKFNVDELSGISKNEQLVEDKLKLRRVCIG